MDKPKAFFFFFSVVDIGIKKVGGGTFQSGGSLV